MGSKYELAAYLSDLITIMDSKEATGLAKGQTLIREYNSTYAQLKEAIEDETRTSPVGSIRT